MFCIAFTFSGSREIPLELMTNPKNFPVDTPIKDLVGFIFNWVPTHDIEHLPQISKMISMAAAFDGNVVHIALDRFADVGPKDLIHCLLICGSRILQAKGHECVAQYPPGVLNEVLRIGGVHLDLVVSQESIHKGHALKATCIVDHDVHNR